MPKPKSGELYIRELRITPPDGLPITEWKVTEDDFKVCVAAEEGGDEKRLHYHLYIESFRSETWIKKWIYSIAHCYNGESGNSVFFTRKPHENTIAYVVKYGNVVVRHGCSQTYIDEWITKSNEYRQNKESIRKRVQRSRQGIIKQICEEVASGLKGGSVEPSWDTIADELLNYFKLHDIYPIRSQFELMVIKLIHPYKPEFVRSFYTNSFSRL